MICSIVKNYSFNAVLDENIQLRNIGCSTGSGEQLLSGISTQLFSRAGSYIIGHSLSPDFQNCRIPMTNCPLEDASVWTLFRIIAMIPRQPRKWGILSNHQLAEGRKYFYVVCSEIGAMEMPIRNTVIQKLEA
jgi:hypothetical protein